MGAIRIQPDNYQTKQNQVDQTNKYTNPSGSLCRLLTDSFFGLLINAFKTTILASFLFKSVE
ncbi:hypothetical protein [Streptococcus oralis]|uniref:hypothetical protein n=1 Tax=Streptococcus oralis TaxID=1303 RepID=UPI001F2261F6|nr:hypothetical protein [Streptococcus oralis]UJD02128.1 hypothetical protein GOM47_05165 [Streptococcus oralis]